MVNTTSPPAITAGDDATINYLLSGVLSGGEICKATELAACLPLWFSDVKENKPIASAIPELLGRLLLPFGTPAVLEHVERLQAPDSLTDRQRWMEKLRVLMNDEAHERLLQKLESLQDQQLSFKTLYEQENEDDMDDGNLAADPTRTLQFDYDMRDLMIRGDKKGMRKHPDVFYVTGSVAWTVRSPYWNVALATDEDGNRFLSDDILDEVLPKWRQILHGETIPTPRYGVVDSFRLWLASEEKKANDLGKPWPSTPARSTRFKFVTPEPYSRLRTLSTSGLSPIECTPNVPIVPIVTDSVQTELLREILTEVKELKTIISQILESKQELGTTENQMHGSLQPAYPPIPSATQPNFFCLRYQGPTTKSGPGAGSARRR
ncbi:hypothetical protein N7491_005596 [Penicillium cf. griseofulvum]|nr:hypothetical protein N7491_005596 [Penicillium cf. griseofulvum]